MKADRPIRLRRIPQQAVPAGGSIAPGLDGVDPLLARLFAARGVTEPSQLRLDLASLIPIRSLPGIDEAIATLLAHRDRRIVVVGDFDADGATSTALVCRCLRDFGFAAVDYLVPNRFEFGYGLTPEIVRVSARLSPSLLITVDNGISSIAGVAEAAAMGIEVLITDHHLPGSELPAARAIVNPNVVPQRANERFASAHLAGVGVAFYVMAALGRTLEEQGHAQASRVPARYLDLVALGTIADVVPLDQNNRILVSQGLRRIRAKRCVAGIEALLAIGGRDFSRATGADLGFGVGPRLNAAGRLDDMSVGIECLLADDPGVAAQLAGVLDRINSERREIEAGMREEAFAVVDAMAARGLPSCVCVFDRGWHQGIVGLVAARVRERCHRPAVAFARDGSGMLKGSARSVPGIHIRDLLEAVAVFRPGMIDRFGGHAMAAGLTLAEEDFAAFSRVACEQLERLHPAADYSGAIVSDGELPQQGPCLEIARLIRDAGPWGSGFPEPLWNGDFELLEQRTVGERHLKLRLRPLAGAGVVDAIAFNQAGPAFRGRLRLAFRLEVNEWRGVESPQLVVEQITGIAS